MSTDTPSYLCEENPELWKPIPDLDGTYEISTHGRVRSVDRYIQRSDTGTSVFIEGKLLKQQVNRYGYLHLKVSINNISCMIRPHRLVAIVFIDNPHNKREVNHIDGNKQNNHISNLEWVTASENIKHAIATGLLPIRYGEQANGFERAVDVFKDGMYTTTLYGNRHMKEFGVDFRLVSACLKGKRKSHKGYTFKIKED